ncbi:MAG TPA: lipase family protein, partial [Sphingomicrobium sp.]
PDAQLVTFGSPRVGDEGFAALFAGRDVRRYVDCTDLVTSVPPQLLGYVHVGPERYIDCFGTVQEKPPSPEAIAEDRRFARGSYAVKHAWKVWRNVLIRDLADHAPVNYVSAVLGRRARR